MTYEQPQMDSATPNSCASNNESSIPNPDGAAASSYTLFGTRYPGLRTSLCRDAAMRKRERRGWDITSEYPPSELPGFPSATKRCAVHTPLQTLPRSNGLPYYPVLDSFQDESSEEEDSDPEYEFDPCNDVIPQDRLEYSDGSCPETEEDESEEELLDLDNDNNKRGR